MTGIPRDGGRRGLSRSATAVPVVLVAVLLGPVTGCDRGGQPPAATPDTQAAGTVPTAPVPGLPRSEPDTVEIPKIGAKSTLVKLGLNPDSTLQTPPVSQPMQAGWYALGPTPGEIGPAVIVGHVDGNKQKGIFYRLKELRGGDDVVVSRKDGAKVVFAVSRVEQIDKDSFPTEAVYGNTAGPELRLITCGGGFDRSVHSYRDNIIAYATRKSG